MNPWDDPRIARGMKVQLETRRARIVAGETPLGWKVGFGAPASMELLKISAPVVGYLMQRALLAPGGTVSLRGWTKPVAEPEIAVRMASDLGADASPDDVAAAVEDIRPAIELADLDITPAPDKLEQIVAGDIFQRHVLLSAEAQAGASTAGLTSRVERRGVEVARTTELEALTGKVIDTVAHVASLLAAFGEKLAAGDVVICGSITPPLILEADEPGIRHAIDPIGEVSVKFG
ncbi:MAG TPA: fumarylacetoacetate hydrolase family protein [Pseudolabrys sp.]|nr:fumarylacetoacetate hydrolase family protein [Pseudolabrys sp.]